MACGIDRGAHDGEEQGAVERVALLSAGGGVAESIEPYPKHASGEAAQRAGDSRTSCVVERDQSGVAAGSEGRRRRGVSLYWIERG